MASASLQAAMCNCNTTCRMLDSAVGRFLWEQVLVGKITSLLEHWWRGHWFLPQTRFSRAQRRYFDRKRLVRDTPRLDTRQRAGGNITVCTSIGWRRFFSCVHIFRLKCFWVCLWSKIKSELAHVQLGHTVPRDPNSWTAEVSNLIVAIAPRPRISLLHYIGELGHSLKVFRKVTESEAKFPIPTP